MADLDALPELPPGDLRARYQALYGRPPPARIGTRLLARAVAWQLQVNAAGGLTPSVTSQLRRLAQAPRADRPSRSQAGTTTQLTPGTRLVREWQGRTHTVFITDDGFEYAGARYASLSAIARAITGTRWSGPAFFGLRPGQRR